MPVASVAPLRTSDSLAVAPVGMVRSPAKMDSAIDTQARLQKAKERLYVICQLGGWIFFALVQAFFALTFSPSYVDPVKLAMGMAQAMSRTRSGPQRRTGRVDPSRAVAQLG